MGSCFDCFKKIFEKNESPEPGSILRKAKLMKRTANGRLINNRPNKALINKSHQDKICRTNTTWFLKMIFSADLIVFNKITDNLFLTGFGGIVEENIKENDIKHIVNATYELPLLKVSGIESIRVPVEDIPEENISLYFNDVSDQIDQWIRENHNIVVHCLGGVSRSATLVMAYLIKYKNWDLKTVYNYVKEKRKIVKPNHSFFEQLIDYEKKILKNSSVKMIVYTLTNGRKIKIPDFIIKECPGDEEKEEFGQPSLDSTLVSAFLIPENAFY